MRQVIDDFIFSNEDAILLVSDLGKFPKTYTTSRYINVGASETLLVNAALGLALAGKHVYMYSAANFVLYRAFEQLKINILGNSSCNIKQLNITLLNGGSGFCYAGCGIGHYLLDDMHIAATCLKNITCYFPYDKASTAKALVKSMQGINYIRLCLDSQIDRMHVKTNNSMLNIATFGWLVEVVDRICKQLHVKANVIPIFTLSQLSTLKNYIIIYDNFATPALKTEECIATYCLANAYDCIGMNRLQTLKKYKFDDVSLAKFIKQYV